MKKDRHVYAICAYKESEFLEECIHSLNNQTISSSIIMVTSTPNDHIIKISQRYKIPLYINDEGGIVQDWNFAYKMADATYVTIAHQDDIYLPKYTERILYHMQKAKKPIICFTNYLEIRDGKKVVTNKLLQIKRLMLLPLKIRCLQGSKLVRRLILAFGCPICCPSVTFSKKGVGKDPFRVGFRSDEDWEAWEKLSHMKGEFIYDSEILMGHRIHKESETTTILGDNARTREDYIMFKKFWPEFIAKKLAKLYSSSEKSNEL